MLDRSQEFARSSKAQILLRETKPVVDGTEHVEPPPRRLPDVPADDENAPARALRPAHAARS